MAKYIDITDERFWQIMFDEACVEGQQADRIQNELEKIAVEPNRGEWIKTFRYMRENINTRKLEPVHSYDCPICKYHTGNQGCKFNFCPNCGADMRKGGDNNV